MLARGGTFVIHEDDIVPEVPAPGTDPAAVAIEERLTRDFEDILAGSALGRALAGQFVAGSSDCLVWALLDLAKRLERRLHAWDHYYQLGPWRPPERHRNDFIASLVDIYEGASGKKATASWKDKPTGRFARMLVVVNSALPEDVRVASDAALCASAKRVLKQRSMDSDERT